ncbi:MAG: SCO family protein [Anaerolineae bacterium]
MLSAKQTKVVLYSFAGIVLVVLGMIGWRYRPYNFHGMVMSSRELAPNFTLLSANTGEHINLRDFKDQVVLLYFGYTTCPDVCPATLRDVAAALQKLGRKADQVQVIMITVDPERDSPEILKDYMGHFNPNFIGLVPETPEETLAVATQYGIYYEKHFYGSEAGYLMDHTATITLVDKDGYARVIYPFGTTPDDLAADLNYILSRW